MKWLDKIANIAVILGVAVFIFVVVRGEFAKRKAPDDSPRTLVGTSISLPGLQLDQTHNSLLVAISTTCHFCQDSLPFYKELAAKAQGKIDVIAVLPQTTAESEAFLQKAGVSATKVVSARLDSIGVRGTPTMLLVDTHGKVQEEWRGFQDEKGRQQVLARVLQ